MHGAIAALIAAKHSDMALQYVDARPLVIVFICLAAVAWCVLQKLQEVQ